MNRASTGAADADPGQGDPVVTRQIAAEAAVWVARLHGPDRSPRMERECLAWQARSAAHRLAFEKCTDTWQDVPRVTLGDAYAASQRQAGVARGGTAVRSRRTRWVMGTAFAVLCAAVGVGLQQWREAGLHKTDVGEQQLLVLEDGSRVSLNTDSRVQVSLSSSQRLVTIEAGEALFEVAKDPARPFVVRAAGTEVVAVGTTFAVRLDDGQGTADGSLAVTLVEGKVTVRHAVDSASSSMSPAEPVAMRPGERMRLTRLSGLPQWTQKLDRPRIDAVLAWKRSLATFDNVSLVDAVAEMNRYSRTKIVLVNRERLASLRVSGDFQTADTAGFARAVASLHDLRLQEARGRLELTAPQWGKP